ncbi:hypothetical protein TraAM80_07020, partial [Trypanosoma rangeli]
MEKGMRVEQRHKSVSSFQGHSLVEADGVMVALALAAYNDCGAVYADIWARWKSYGEGSRLGQDATREERREALCVTKLFVEEGRDSRVPSPKAVVKENKNI